MAMAADDRPRTIRPMCRPAVPVPTCRGSALLDAPSPFAPLPRFSRRARSTGVGDLGQARGPAADGFGGNKLRNLEFLVGAALAEGADTPGHERAALVEPRPPDRRRRGDGRPRRPARAVRTAADPPSPGVRLDEPLGATVHLLATEDRAEREAAVERWSSAELRAGGARPYVIGVGGCGTLGAYRAGPRRSRAVRPGRAAGIAVDRIVVPSATGGTQAGLIVAARRPRRRARAWPAWSWRARPTSFGRRSRRCGRPGRSRWTPTARRSTPGADRSRRERIRRRATAIRPPRRGGAPRSSPAPRAPRRPDLHGQGAGRPRRLGPLRRVRMARRSSSGTPAACPASSSRSTDAPAARPSLPGRPPRVAQLHPAAGLQHGARVDPRPDQEQDPDADERDRRSTGRSATARSHRTRPATGPRTAPTAAGTWRPSRPSRRSLMTAKIATK